MYTLTQGQPVQGTGYIVWQGGTYAPLDLVLCAYPESNQPEVQYLAVYVATGQYEVPEG